MNKLVIIPRTLPEERSLEEQAQFPTLSKILSQHAQGEKVLKRGTARTGIILFNIKDVKNIS